MMPAARTHIQVTLDLFTEGYLLAAGTFDPNVLVRRLSLRRSLRLGLRLCSRLFALSHRYAVTGAPVPCLAPRIASFNEPTKFATACTRWSDFRLFSINCEIAL